MDNERRILELLNGGDWACAYNERQSLAHVCRKLSLLVEGELADKAREIAQASDHDMRSATRGWADFAAALRSPQRRGPRRSSSIDNHPSARAL